MECVKFSETKAERKYYEDKKQKALERIDESIKNYPYVEANSGLSLTRRKNDNILEAFKEIKKLVDDI